MPTMSPNKDVQKTAQDWVRDLRFSNQVNMQTMGVDTDRVTPQLLLASSNKLLGISKGQQEGDMKDSLQFQRFYGPVEYFAERIQKDGGSVARSMLWKATNRGNLDFIGAGSLQPHVNAVFHESNLSQFIDNSTPIDGIDNSQKVTRIGEGGLSDEDSAPIEMRLVQPSYYGYVDPVRTAEKCYDEKTQIYTKKGWKSVTEMSLEDEFAVLIDGKPSWSKPISLQSFDHDGLMYCFANSYINFSVTPGHRMYVADQKVGNYSIEYIDNVFGNSKYVLCGAKKASEVDEKQKWFYLPKIPQVGTIKNIDKVDIVDFARFMGWYLSEGSFDLSHTGSGSPDYRVRITQSPELHPEYYEEIRDLVEKLPFGAHPKHYWEATSSDITIKRKQLYCYLEQFGGSLEKFIPDWIFEAPTEARWAFVDAILKGDGSDQRDLNTISKRLAEDFARLLFELGQSVRIIEQDQNYVSHVTGKPTGPIYQVTWHKRYEHRLQSRKREGSKGYHTCYYKGKVYCPTVPGGLVYVRRNNSKGFWCGNSPGITGYLTKNVLKGTDGKLYQKFINMHTGKEELVDAQTAAKSIVTTDEYLDSKDEYVYAIGGPRGLRIVKRSDVDYILPHSDDAFSASANTVPMLSGIKAMRLLMGCHHPETPVAVVDYNGYTHIVPAKRLGHMGQIYVLGCDKKGRDQIYAVRKIITRVPAKKSKFKKVILSSGRVLLTSAEHKWWIYNEKFQLKQAKDLQEGMLVPRSLFTSMPVRLTEIMGTPVTREICVFMGRLIRSLRATNYSYRVDFVKDKERGVDQSTDIVTALEQLGIKNYNLFHSRGIHAVSIKDPVFEDWVNEHVGMLPEDRKIPSEILSLPEGYTSIFLDSYYKDLQTIGEDNQGDTWLLSIANPALRDSMSFMLNKIYTDTKYRDYTKKDFIHRALELVPASTSIGDIVLEKITKIMDVQAPPVMIDIDCDDNVYAVANGIITHNSKYVSQAVPLQQREAPLVRGLDSATGMDMPTKMGKLLGTQWAPKSGMVKAVRDDRIDMIYDDGTAGSVPLYKNFPANAKGWLTNYPKVKAGDKVSEGQLLASSNYTDDNGVLAMGRNLRMAYMSYHGGTYEDATTISESAAKKLGYTTMYKTDMDKDKSIRTAKHLYTAWKPGKFTKEQLQNLDDQGVVKVGATINKGDPVILGIRTTEPSPGTLGKRILSDVTEIWEHANPGTVTDVVNGKNGIKVFATVSSPLREGDKLTQFYGGKATIAQIIPDDQMPRDSKGRPLDLLFDPLGIVSRTNPSQMMQAGLGKVAMKTGKPIVVPAFMPKGQSRLKYVKDLMKANNVPWKEDIFDPATGRTIKNVFSGVMYFLPLKHIADTKMSARGTAQYTAQQVPMGGGQQGCFPAMQNIITLHGEQSIAHICEKKIPEYVMSWDEERKEWRWKQITDWFTYRAKVQNILNIFTENSISIYGDRCRVKHTNSSYPTKNHKMYMADGSIKLAGELKVGDYLAGIGCQYTEDQMQALYGTLMGDSCRTPDGGIQCMHSVKQSAYINYKRDIFAAVGASRVSEPKEVKGGVKGRDGVWKEYKPTAAIRMQVPKSYYVQKALQLTTDSAGKRHLTIPVLEAMGEFGFCLWFLDDGSMHNHIKHKGKPQPQARIATHSFSVQEVEVAAKWLQKNLLHVENGTHISIYKGIYDQDQPCLDFRREASWEIARIVAKHIPWEVIPKSKMWLREYCKGVQEKTPCVKHNFMSPLGIVPLKIKEIKPYKHDKPNVTEVNVYDFTVEDTHNYALTGGVRVSNSKKIGSLQSAALVGHNAFNFLHDAKLIRGQANSDFWRSIRTGQIPTVPGEPLAHKKFFAHLQGSGMQIKRDNEGFTIFALSNKDVNELAGSRQLKSTDTYEQKSFRPIAGGLFGQDIFGPDGDKWAYIQLDSPLPNPVMQEPLARLLGISDTEFQQIVRGKGSKEGLRNARDMKKVLSKMDLQKEANKALAELKTSTKSQKDKALKKYVAIARMRDAGVRPQEYMLDRIPVLPPKFRPITSHGGLTMVADSNYLYSQLLNARDDLREAKDLPEEYQEEGQSNLYQKWKELVGLYDPQDVKLKSKNVKGLLKWALGSKGPKFSAYMQKVLGSTVDTVGRGVIIPSTKIKLNEVGLPVEMAWNLYSPFVVRKLVQQGYSPVDAMQQVKEHKPVAAEALAEAVKERPVVMNRAPSLHKLSLMGFNAKLTGGHAIKINPSICPPFGADFDGNCVDFDSEISLKISKSALDKLEKSCSLYQTLTKESNMPTIKETRIEASQQKPEGTVYGTIKIGEFPRFGTPVKDRNGADVYKVPKGFEVEACDPETGERGFYPIEALTVENDCDTVKVTAGNHSVIVSSNESLAAFDTATGKLTKVAPKDIGNRLVPVLKKDLTPFGTAGNRDLGWLIGGLISDGWVVGNVVGYAKLEDAKRAEIERIFRELNPNFLIKEYKEETEPGKNKLGESAKIHIYSPEIAEYVRNLEILDKEGDKAKKTACSKQINRQMLVNGSEEFLWGLLSGLIDGDGSITVNTTLKNPRFGIRYATSSPSLRDSFCALLYKLGIRYSITTTPPRNWSNEAYTICLSTIDVYANIDKLTCVGSREKELLQKWKDTAPVYEDRNDQVPVSDFEWQMLKIVCNNKTDASVYSTCMKKKENRSAMRASILKYKEHLKTAAPSLLKRAEETNTLWYPVDSVEDAGKRQVFDLMVNDAKVFAVNNGLVVWDTVNIHVPVSKKAVQDVRQKMMPERNLISLRKGSILYGPEKGYVQGLYVATRMGESKDVKTFETTADARKAYLNGQIDIDTPIVIKEK